jgi:hypothetical protein
MRFVAAALFTTLLALAGCGGGDSSDDDGPPPLPVTLSPAADQKVLLGGTVNFSSTVTAGTGPYTFLWTFGGAHADMTVEDPGSITFSTAGVFVVTCTVKDSTGWTGSSSVTITVKTVLATISSPAAPPTIYKGGTVNFQGTASGPVATHAWVFPGGSPATWTAEDPGNVTFGTVGAFTVTYTVNDGAGGTDTASVVVTVQKTLVSIDVTPATYDLVQGQYVDYTVMATFSDGPAQNVTASCTFLSSDTDKVTLSGNRATAATGQPTGTVTITATYVWDVTRQDTATINTLAGTRYTIAQIKTQYNLLKPVLAHAAYGTPPVMQVDDLGTPGSLSTQTTTDGLNWTNFYRWLAGLPANITINSTNAGRCQRGSHVLTMLNYLSWPHPVIDPHNPPLPTGATTLYQTNIYTPGEAACGESNIFRGWYSPADGGASVPSLPDCVDGWMDDFGNEGTLGHRRWILHPTLNTTAFGMTWKDHPASTNHTDYSTLMHVFDTSASMPTFDYVAYPSEGYYPKLCFEDPPVTGQDPTRTLWSFSANSAKYNLDASTTVTVVRQTGSVNIPVTVTVLPAGYGITPTISFNPGESTLGETYNVTISGILRLSDNARITYSYWVNFFDVTLP